MSHIPVVALGLLEIVAVPVILCSIFWFNRFDIQTNEFVWRYGKLTENYVRQYYWWEVVVLVRKTSIVMVADLINNWDPQLKIFLVEIVLLLHIFAEYLFQPRSREVGYSAALYPIFHLFQMFALLVSSLVFNSIANAEPNEVAFFQVVLIILFALLCCLVLGSVVVGTITNVIKEAKFETTTIVQTHASTGRVVVSEEFAQYLPDAVMTVNPNVKDTIEN
eukprot:TRINITY_DN12463_c0_g1_i1.p1 TRINITY_DN12463_c0_g1~~TRINITY_DN12463_c0_g1_i1.p1  ORF type:complete len:237 (-),score=48.88 TRINITY_DN12463_c0_g1_i1:46-708(-)